MTVFICDNATMNIETKGIMPMHHLFSFCLFGLLFLTLNSQAQAPEASENTAFTKNEVEITVSDKWIIGKDCRNAFDCKKLRLQQATSIEELQALGVNNASNLLSLPNAQTILTNITNCDDFALRDSTLRKLCLIKLKLDKDPAYDCFQLTPYDASHVYLYQGLLPSCIAIQQQLYPEQIPACHTDYCKLHHSLALNRPEDCATLSNDISEKLCVAILNQRNSKTPSFTLTEHVNTLLLELTPGEFNSLKCDDKKTTWSFSDTDFCGNLHESLALLEMLPKCDSNITNCITTASTKIDQKLEGLKTNVMSFTEITQATCGDLLTDPNFTNKDIERCVKQITERYATPAEQLQQCLRLEQAEASRCINRAISQNDISDPTICETTFKQAIDRFVQSKESKHPLLSACSNAVSIQLAVDSNDISQCPKKDNEFWVNSCQSMIFFARVENTHPANINCQNFTTSRTIALCETYNENLSKLTNLSLHTCNDVECFRTVARYHLTPPDCSALASGTNVYQNCKLVEYELSTDANKTIDLSLCSSIKKLSECSLFADIKLANQIPLESYLTGCSAWKDADQSTNLAKQVCFDKLASTLDMPELCSSKLCITSRIPKIISASAATDIERAYAAWKVTTGKTGKKPLSLTKYIEGIDCSTINYSKYGYINPNLCSTTKSELLANSYQDVRYCLNKACVERIVLNKLYNEIPRTSVDMASIPEPVQELLFADKNSTEGGQYTLRLKTPGKHSWDWMFTENPELRPYWADLHGLRNHITPASVICDEFPVDDERFATCNIQRQWMVAFETNDYSQCAQLNCVKGFMNGSMEDNLESLDCSTLAPPAALLNDVEMVKLRMDCQTERNIRIAAQATESSTRENDATD